MKHIRNICAGLLIAGTLLLITGCETRVRAEGGAYYDYDYYPTHNVYYSSHERVYYWNESGNWRSGRNLPTRFDIHNENHQPIHTQSRQPWTEHHDDNDHHDSDHDHDRH
jgi:hypothetical protein